MMHGREKSDPVIVAEKPTNKAERSVAEPVERRAGAKGNAPQQSTGRAQNRVTVSQALERIRKAATAASPSCPRCEPCAGIPHARICAGGGW
jgi:RNA-directed DNA polymerase